MNSTEGYKGFVTFLILTLIVGLTVIGFSYITNSSPNLNTKAADQSAIPYNIRSLEITSDSATITWDTQTNSGGKVIYSTEQYGCPKNCIETKEQNKTIGHSVLLNNLEPNTTYYYQIMQQNRTYPDEPLSFKTDTINIIALPDVEKIGDDQQNDNSTKPENKNPADIKTGTKMVEEPDNSTLAPAGYYNSNSLKEGPFNTSEPKKENEVLGTTSNLIAQEIIEEFKEAVKYQDLNYDFNKDEKVTNTDYPLFMNYIASQ